MQVEIKDGEVEQLVTLTVSLTEAQFLRTLLNRVHEQTPSAAQMVEELEDAGVEPVSGLDVVAVAVNPTFILE